jgi:putative ABC transport system permease protein
MIKNMIKIAWRNMRRNKTHSIINIAGLGIGMCCLMLIMFYIQDELSYDRFFKKSERIYQVNLDGNMDGNEFTTGNTPPTVGPALLAEFPEIESYARIYRPGDILVSSEDRSSGGRGFTEKKVLAVDSNFLDLFNYEMLQGDVATCLSKPNSVVITEDAARKYFGNANAVGKILLFDTTRNAFIVTGVVKNIPPQSSWQFDMLATIASYPAVKRFSWSWVWLQVNTYIRLRDNVPNDKKSIAKLEAKTPDMVRKHAASAFRRIGKPYDELVKSGGKWDFKFQPLSRVHLYSSDIGSRVPQLSDIKYVYIFSIIAFFIIILACVNFMNLSTAQSAVRAKEVGIRKVLGSIKGQLIRQFLVEALVYSFIAMLVALVLVILLIQPFNSVSGKSLSPSLIFSGYNWLYITGLMIITGLLAGSYPAFYLTAFKPIAVLKRLQATKSGVGNLVIRNGLVVFQFAVSTGLIACTLVVLNQLRYTQNKNLGLDKENVIVIANSNRLGNSEEAFRQELMKMPGVIHASRTTGIPSRVNFQDSYIPEQGSEKEQLIKEISLASFVVDEDFIPALRINVEKGRNFSREFADSAAVILNETAARQIGWEDPLGKYLEYPGNSQRFKVIGIVKDFNIESLRSLIAPFALFHSSSQTYDLGSAFLTVRVAPGKLDDHLRQLESKWNSFAANTPFDYSFLDSEFAAMYRPENRMSSVFSIFTMLSIFVACLGLFGLAAYTAERRTREIGVRKVLGASTRGLVALLTKDFIRLVLLSALIAFPVAWWFMNKWLEDFAYRITIQWWIFAIAGLLAGIIALCTISFQAVKAAMANPVKSLRTE